MAAVVGVVIVAVGAAAATAAAPPVVVVAAGVVAAAAIAVVCCRPHCEAFVCSRLCRVSSCCPPEPQGSHESVQLMFRAFRLPKAKAPVYAELAPQGSQEQRKSPGPNHGTHHEPRVRIGI